MIVDAHQHFWDPARGDYGWLKPDNPIHRIFSPDDLKPLMQETGVDATILVQAAPTTAETDYLLSLARHTPWILGVVGWIDFEAADAAAQLRVRAADPLFLGVRPMLQDIAQPDWILRPELEPALRAIVANDLVFDALVLPHQIGVIEKLSWRYPSLRIVLDHGAKPKLGNARAMEAWRAEIASLSRRENVACKLSGLLTELPAGGGAENVQDVARALFELFGAQRLIWGSDWPVLTLASDYRNWFTLATDLIGFGNLRAVMGTNAVRLYRPTRLVPNERKLK